MSAQASRSSPSREARASFALWLFVLLGIWNWLEHVEERYDLFVKVRDDRITCEARGGLYGAWGKAPPRCFER